MRVRALDANGDMSFGHGQADFLINSPEAVAQVVRTRLLLLQGEWFLDVTDGLAFSTAIAGYNTRPTYDLAIRERILETQGVLAIESYSSARDPQRRLTVSATISTIYGQTTIQETL